MEWIKILSIRWDGLLLGCLDTAGEGDRLFMIYDAVFPCSFDVYLGSILSPSQNVNSMP